MSKQKLLEARDLMSAQRYDEARAILEKLDHPKAKEWLVEIEKSRPKRRGNPPSGSIVGSLLRFLLTVIISLLLTTLLIAGLVLGTRSYWDKGRSSSTAARIEATSTPIANSASSAGEFTPELTVEAVATASAPTGVVAANQSINVRNGPATSYSSVKTLMPGTRVEIIGQSEDGTWQNVRLSDGTVGWVSTSLLRLSATVTPVGQANTQVSVETTPEASTDCAETEAQAWWDTSARAIYSEARLTLLRTERYTRNPDTLQSFVDGLGARRQAFEDTSYPSCVTEVRENLLAGLTEVVGGLTDYIANQDASALTGRLAQARTYFDPAINRLTTDLGVSIFTDNCAVVTWVSALGSELTEAMNIIETYDPATATPDTVRSLIFDVQRARRAVEDAAHPECVEVAHAHLLGAMDAYISLFQAVFDGNTGVVQARQATGDAEMGAFLAEMERLGFPLE